MWKQARTSSQQMRMTGNLYVPADSISFPFILKIFRTSALWTILHLFNCTYAEHKPLPVPWLHWDTCERMVEAVRDHAVQEHGGSEDCWAGGWQLSLGQHRQDVLTGGMLEVWYNLLWQPAQEFLLLEKGGKTRAPLGLAWNIFGYLSPSKRDSGYQHVKYIHRVITSSCMFLYALEILPDRINVCDVSAINGFAHDRSQDLWDSIPVLMGSGCAWLCYGPHSKLFLSRKLQQEVSDPY